LICYAIAGRKSVRRALVALSTLLILSSAAVLADRPKQSREELINPLLGPEWSQWLVGPISWIATSKEIGEFLSLLDDGAAAEFVERFWKNHDPYPLREDNPLRETYEERLEKANELYAEGGFPGYRTDRGIVFVVYGEPSKTDQEVAPDPGDPLIQVWEYDKDIPKGLDGKKPDRAYRFIKRGELTVFYSRLNEFERRRRRAREPFRP
jgi:GWxTD domain-containing protein